MLLKICQNALTTLLHSADDMLLICNIIFLCLGIKPTLGYRTNIILPYIMYISPIETPKLNNLDIRITYEGYSFKGIWSEMSNMWYVL